MLLNNLHTNVLKKISDYFSERSVFVVAYPQLEEIITTPAIIVEMNELDPMDKQPATGELALNVHFSATILVGFNDESDFSQKISVADLTASLMDFIQGNQFDLGIGSGVVSAARPDNFDEQLDGYFAWRFDWTHEVRIGSDYWRGDKIKKIEVTINGGVSDE
jgi:hypothetical protein